MTEPLPPPFDTVRHSISNGHRIGIYTAEQMLAFRADGVAAHAHELETLREFAAGRCTIRSVIDALGPMSLWSKAAFEREISVAVAAARRAALEEAALVCEFANGHADQREHGAKLAAAIRAL